MEWSHYEGSCYQAYGTGKELSWNEAQDFCVSQGGNLLSVGSEEEEHEVLYRFIFDEMTLTDVLWMGLRRKIDADGESFKNDYEWIDGSLNDYSRFAGMKILRSLPF